MRVGEAGVNLIQECLHCRILGQVSEPAVILVHLEFLQMEEVKTRKEKYRDGEAADMRMGSHSCVPVCVSLLF